jgi:agmatinase
MGPESMTSQRVTPAPWQGFLQSEIGILRPADCLFHVVPALYEKSVSYGSGTAQGPLAILTASQQLELYDGVGVPAEKGIFTQAPLACKASAEQDLLEISAAVARVLEFYKMPVLLGGEHTVTLGALGALMDASTSIGIVQFDAHADLRDTYQNDRLSHACVMRRAIELGYPLFQIGVRSMSTEEVRFRAENGIGHLDAVQIAKNGLPDQILPAGFPDKIYLSIDVDVLDPSIMPATGTPEPGGLTWYTFFDILENIFESHRIIGFDVVELAPIAGWHAADFTCARLIYNLMGFIARSGSRSLDG